MVEGEGVSFVCLLSWLLVWLSLYCHCCCFAALSLLHYKHYCHFIVATSLHSFYCTTTPLHHHHHNSFPELPTLNAEYQIETFFNSAEQTEEGATGTRSAATRLPVSVSIHGTLHTKETKGATPVHGRWWRDGASFDARQ